MAMTGSSQEHKEVSEDIVQKVLRFAEKHETFSTKELIEAYPNNQEYLLRYALFNLRLDEKIFMYGNKRGAFYSLKNNVKTEESVVVQTTENNDIKTKILEKAKTFSGWFKRTDLNITDFSVPTILAGLKELISEGKIAIQGSLRWTEYCFVNNETKKVAEAKTETENELKSKILSYIKKNRVVTIPMIVEDLQEQRYNVVPIIKELEDAEEIWHEGLARASKYIYKDVSMDEMETILAENGNNYRVSSAIDQLSAFLCLTDNATVIGMGMTNEDKFVIKFFKNGNVEHKYEHDNIIEGFNHIRTLTEIANG